MERPPSYSVNRKFHGIQQIGQIAYLRWNECGKRSAGDVAHLDAWRSCQPN